ncbi:MAG TPA: GNAT family N-acetyltransferase [Candidatus Binatia bacterium]|nr:GNAT family N-acetyltransferase [Candidatus Binatia bacterium]
MKLRRVTALREFDALAPVWEEVAREAGQSSPFLSHDWFACCWRTAGPQRRREVWVLEDSAGPLALVPLLHYRTRVRGLPVRVLSFLESPDTPFADLLVARGLDEVMTALVQALRERTDWDLLRLAKLPAAGPTAKALQGVLAAHLPSRVAGHEQSPYLRLAGTWEEFFRSRSQRFRKTCRSIENRIHRRGSLAVEEHRSVDPDGPVFRDLLEVSLASWKADRGVALATMDGMPRFFRELTRRASARGWLRLWVLRLEGRAIATEYQIGANGVVHALRADYDAALADLSPGAYLNLEIVRRLFGDPGLVVYDMGPGVNEYKLRWASGAHELVTLEFYAPTVAGRLLKGLETWLLPTARRWRDRLRPRTS